MVHCDCALLCGSIETLINLTRHMVDYCAFGADRTASTDFWCKLLWEPTGDTGDGRCHKECNAGSWFETLGLPQTAQTSSGDWRQ